MGKVGICEIHEVQTWGTRDVLSTNLKPIVQKEEINTFFQMDFGPTAASTLCR